VDMALCVAETVTQQEIKRSGLPPGLAANSTHIIKARLMGLIASSTFRNGLTLRQALFEATLPAWNARLSAAFSIVRMRLAVALRLRRASSSSGVARVAWVLAFIFDRTLFGAVASLLRHFVNRSGVSFSSRTRPSSGSTKALKVYSALRTASGFFSARISSR